MARSDLTSAEIEELVTEAEEATEGESEFVDKMRGFFDEHGYLTEAQVNGLRNTTNAFNERRRG